VMGLVALTQLAFFWRKGWIGWPKFLQKGPSVATGQRTADPGAPLGRR
jgi:hypothetical protein